MATINTPRREQKELFWKTPEKSSENEEVSTLFHEGLRSLLYAPNYSNFVQKHFSYFYGRGWPRGRKQTETTTDKQTNKQQGTFTDLR